MTKQKMVDTFKEELPQIRTEEEKNFLAECGEAVISKDIEKLTNIATKFNSLSVEMQEQVTNATKMTNRTSILQTMEALTTELGRMPSVLEISAHTGLSKVTVYAHQKEMSAQTYWEHELEALKIQRVKFLNVLAKNGYRDPKVAKMILDLLNTSFIPEQQNNTSTNSETIN